MPPLGGRQTAQGVRHDAVPSQQEGAPTGSQPAPSRGFYAESDDWSVLLGQVSCGPASTSSCVDSSWTEIRQSQFMWFPLFE